MAEESQGQKTEEATPKRVRDARRKVAGDDPARAPLRGAHVQILGLGQRPISRPAFAVTETAPGPASRWSYSFTATMPTS